MGVKIFLARRVSLIKGPAFTGGIILASFWYSAVSGLVFSSKSLKKCLYLRWREQI